MSDFDLACRFDRIDSCIASIKSNVEIRSQSTSRAVVAYFDSSTVAFRLNARRDHMLTVLDQSLSCKLTMQSQPGAKYDTMQKAVEYLRTDRFSSIQTLLCTLKLGRCVQKGELSMFKRFYYNHLCSLVHAIEWPDQKYLTNELFYSYFYSDEQNYLVYNRLTGDLVILSSRFVELRKVCIKLVQFKSKKIQVINNRILILLTDMKQHIQIYVFDTNLNLLRFKKLENVFYINVNQNYIIYEYAKPVNNMSRYLLQNQSSDAARKKLTEFGGYLIVMNYDLEHVDTFDYSHLKFFSSLDLLIRVSFMYILKHRVVIDDSNNDSLVLNFFDRSVNDGDVTLFETVTIRNCTSFVIYVDSESHLYVIINNFIDPVEDESDEVDFQRERENLYCYDLNAKLLFKKLIPMLDDYENVNFLNQLA